MANQQFLYTPNGCRINICNSEKLVNNLKFLIRYFVKNKPGYTLSLFGTSESLINDLSGSGVEVTRDDIIHLYRGNNQNTWVNLPQNVKNKANFVNTKIPNVGNKNKKGCAGAYYKSRLLANFKIPIGKLGIHKLTLVKNDLIPKLREANYGGTIINGIKINLLWGINCANKKIPIFEDWQTVFFNFIDELI
jgi:hypothetical protein